MRMRSIDEYIILIKMVKHKNKYIDTIQYNIGKDFHMRSLDE